MTTMGEQESNQESTRHEGRSQEDRKTWEKKQKEMDTALNPFPCDATIGTKFLRCVQITQSCCPFSGMDSSKIHTQVYSAVRSVFLSKHSQLLKSLNKFQHKK